MHCFLCGHNQMIFYFTSTALFSLWLYTNDYLLYIYCIVFSVAIYKWFITFISAAMFSLCLYTNDFLLYLYCIVFSVVINKWFFTLPLLHCFLCGYIQMIFTLPLLHCFLCGYKQRIFYFTSAAMFSLWLYTNDFLLYLCCNVFSMVIYKWFFT